MDSLSLLNVNVPLWEKILVVVKDILTRADIIALQEVWGFDQSEVIKEFLKGHNDLRWTSFDQFAFVYKIKKVELVKLYDNGKQKPDCEFFESYAYSCRFRVRKRDNPIKLYFKLITCAVQ